MKKKENNSNIPIWLIVLNILICFPILIWPLLFFHVGDMLESGIKYVWIKFFIMLFYPIIYIVNFFLSNKLFKNGYKQIAILISITLGICGGYFFCKILC